MQIKQMILRFLQIQQLKAKFYYIAFCSQLETLFCLKSDKTKFLCFNVDGTISLFNSMPQKLEDHFVYLGKNI